MKLANDSAVLFVGNASIAIASLVLGILTARHLGPEGRGQYYLAVQIMATGALVMSVGMGQAYQYYLTTGALTKSSAVSHMLKQTALVSLLTLAVVAFAGPILRATGLDSLPAGVVYACVVGIVTSVAVIFCNAVLMSSDGGIRRITALNVSASVMNVLALSALVLFGWAGVYGALLAYFLGMFVRLIPAVGMAMAGVTINFDDRWYATTRQLARYSVASFVFTLMVALVFRIDAFIVGSMLGFDDLGKYSISVAFAELALMLPSSIGTALFASLPRHTEADRVSQLQVTTRYVVLLTALICAALAAISSPLVRGLMGEAYSAAVAPLLILLPGVVAMATNYVFANFFAGSGSPHAGAGVFAFGLVVNVCANFLLIPVLGINGAALASSISYIGISVAFYLLVRRTHQLAASAVFLPRLQDVRDMLGWAETVLARKRPRPS